MAAHTASGEAFRRRGQGLSPNLATSPGPQVLHSPRTPSLLSSPQEQSNTAFDLDSNVPSIKLVPSSSSPGLTGLPRLPFIYPSGFSEEYQMDETSEHGSIKDDESRRPFAPSSTLEVPVGPELRRTSSQHSGLSAQSSTSELSSLPTPDFNGTAGTYLGNLQPLLSRTLYDSATFQQRNTMRLISDHVQVQSKPPFQRTLSDDSTNSTSSTMSESTLHDFHADSDIAYHHKLTQKWPKPRSIRSLAQTRKKGRIASTILSQVEGGRGLGIESMGRWTLHKWWLVISICTVLTYGVVAMMFSLRTWFKTWLTADAFIVTDGDLLILMTLAASILVFTAMVGLSGAILNSRPILAVYSLLLWPAFISMLVVGYLSYKRYTFALDQKLSLAWSQYYTQLGRLVIQNSLDCCGYYSAAHDATPSSKCYIRTMLPGCKGKLYRMERANLGSMWSATFALVPLHLLNIGISLLCSNHVTKTFGKGITPKQYRLSIRDVQESRAKLGGSSGGYLSRPSLSRLSTRGTLREDKQRS